MGKNNFMNWNINLATNVEEIDSQHKKYFDILNKLYDLSKQEKNDRQFVGKILYELVEYTKFHFETEERYMKKYKYEDIERHKKEHYKYKGKVAEIARKYLKNEEEIDKELFEYCKKWFYNHIKEIDQDLGKYLKKNGVSVKKL